MSALQFLSSFFTDYNQENKPKTRPYVTLTFAQSIDAKIAGIEGKQLILSGRESIVMTHWMRTMHDAILIGVGTALNDDPQLNTRHLPSCEPDKATNGHDNPYHLPRPIILDSKLRLSPVCKLLANYRNGTGRRPWVISLPIPPNGESEEEESVAWKQRRGVLEEAGARVIEVSADGGDRLSITQALHTINDLGISSLMVEGGAQVINSFLSERSKADQNPVVDSIIVTVAPTFVGEDGVGYNLQLGEEGCKFRHVISQLFGKDTVVGLTSFSLNVNQGDQ